VKATLLVIWAKIQPALVKLYGWSPAAVGIVIEYLGHPIIKFALKVIWRALKVIL
jgi:hypothetical protein